MPLTVYNASGTPVWDTDTVAGGVIADVRSYAAGDTATLTYPAFAGHSVLIVPLLVAIAAGANGVSADTALGYPRVTVVAAATQRRFAVVVR